MACSHVVIVLLAVAITADAKPTAYEILQQHGFPVGLLPQGITGYELDAATGQFLARLDSSCGFELQDSSFMINYEPTIQGVILDGKIEGLKGVSVRVLVVWLNVVEVQIQTDGNSYLPLRVLFLMIKRQLFLL